MDTINAKYAELCSEPSDINEHLPTLRAYTAQCSAAAEFGVRGIVSTWALLKGLAEHEGGAGAPAVAEQPSSPAAAAAGPGQRRLLCLDVEDIQGIGGVADLAAQAGVQLTFIQGNSATAELPYDVDLLFIDTWHIYGHLRRELAAHHRRVRRFILLHDTTVDAERGETLRMGWDPEAQAREAGYPVEEVTRGLWPAVEEFLEAQGGEWELAERYTNNNGLTVLRRRRAGALAGDGG